MLSRITNGPTEKLFTATLLNKHQVQYYRCCETGFVQTEDPYWLDEAYSEAITEMDIGLLRRNNELSEKFDYLLRRLGTADSQYLDYGGGYGVMTRLMRDRGHNFYHCEEYCTNLFAKHFQRQLDLNQKYDLITAIEFIEHTFDPVDQIKKLLSYTDTLLLSTELQPEPTSELQQWPYLAFETGQHISFFTVKSLQAVADMLGVHLHTDKKQLHILTRKTFDFDPVKVMRMPWLPRKLKRLSQSLAKSGSRKLPNLADQDADMIKELLDYPPQSRQAKELVSEV